MKTIEFAPDGVAVADAHAERLAREFLDGPDTYVKVSCDTFILAVRALIAEGVYSHEGVRFLFEGQYLVPNRHSRIASRPHGFCDVGDRLTRRILEANDRGTR